MGEFGHYARILVDVDLASKLPSSIHLNREGGGIKVAIQYENLPLFCSACNNVGHSIATCRRIEKQRDAPSGKQNLGGRDKLEKLAPGLKEVEKEGLLVEDQSLKKNLTPLVVSQQRQVSPILHDRFLKNSFGVLAADDTADPLVLSPPKTSWADAVEEAQEDVGNVEEGFMNEEIVDTEVLNDDLMVARKDMHSGIIITPTSGSIGELNQEDTHDDLSLVTAKVVSGRYSKEVEVIDTEEQMGVMVAGTQSDLAMSSALVPFVPTNPAAQSELMDIASDMDIVEHDNIGVWQTSKRKAGRPTKEESKIIAAQKQQLSHAQRPITRAASQQSLK